MCVVLIYLKATVFHKRTWELLFCFVCKSMKKKRNPTFYVLVFNTRLNSFKTCYTHVFMTIVILFKKDKMKCTLKLLQMWIKCFKSFVLWKHQSQKIYWNIYWCNLDYYRFSLRKTFNTDVKMFQTIVANCIQ